MKQDYFIHDGVKYISGTQIRLMRYPYDDPIFSDIAYFIYYDTEYDFVWFRMCYTGRRHGCSMKAFRKCFGGATGKVEHSILPPTTNKLKDYQIPGLMIGWAWYVAIMLIFTISTLVIPGWIITSTIFFRWRNKVIKKEGNYVEW